MGQLSSALSQNLSINFFKKDDLLNFMTDMLIIPGSKKQDNRKSFLRLKNGYQIEEYKIFKQTIQSVTPNKYNTINLLAGYYLNEMVMVVDNNRNADFTDDNVYLYKIEDRRFTNKEFRNSLPLIKIDSLEILQPNGDRIYYSTCIHFCPTVKNNRLFSGFTEMPKFNDVGLLIFNDSSYYTKEFIIENEKYHIEIVPNSIVFPVYPVSNSNISSAMLFLVKHVKYDSMALAGSQSLGMMVLKEKELSFQDRLLKIEKYDIVNKIIEFSINKQSADPDTTSSFLSVHQYQLLSDMKKHLIPIAEREYTVIEFGGSWCKPCNEILPQIEKLYENVKDSIKVISIFKESNLQNALYYYKKVKPKWDTYFEALNCDSAACLAKLFEVGLYPTVLLLDKTGKQLFKATGSDCIKQLNYFLKSNLKKV